MATSAQMEVNRTTLLQCREQIGLTLEEAKKICPRIGEMEQQGGSLPIKQLRKLSEKYRVPSWVLTAEKLPEEYCFEQSPAFRKLGSADQSTFNNYAVRRLTALAGELRSLILDLHESIDEPIANFNPPTLINSKQNAEEAARKVRHWLDISRPLEFEEYKKRLEERNVFVLVTSRQPGKLRVEEGLFRGLAIYENLLPTVVINGRDRRRAHSFTLFHELGHLLLRNTSIDGAEGHDGGEEETWCDRLAGAVLVPQEDVPSGNYDLDKVGSLSAQFKIGAYAFLVRLKALNRISQRDYADLRERLTRRHNETRARKTGGGGRRDRPGEIKSQYGNLYLHAVFSAYQNREISLTRLCGFLGGAKEDHVLRLQRSL